jgi:hypothetical protein
MIGSSVYSYYLFCGECDARLGGLPAKRLRYCPFCAAAVGPWTFADGYEQVHTRPSFGDPDPDFYDAGDWPKEGPDFIEGRVVHRRELPA